MKGLELIGIICLIYTVLIILMPLFVWKIANTLQSINRKLSILVNALPDEKRVDPGSDFELFNSFQRVNNFQDPNQLESDIINSK